MDHKKVGNLVPLDGNGKPFIFDDNGQPKLFHAEFNHGYVKGNVTGAEGTFSGTLTADAVDAVGNLQLRRGAVGTSFASYHAPKVGFSEIPDWRVGSWPTTLSLSFFLPDSGWLMITAAYRLNDPASVDHIRMVGLRHNGNRLYQEFTASVKDGMVTSIARTSGEGFQIVESVQVGPGYHTITFHHWANEAPGTCYTEIYDIHLLARYVRA